MPRLPGIRRVLQWPSTRRIIARHVDEEIDFHLATRTQELIARGMTPEAARQTAEREFGDVRAARAELTVLDANTARRHRIREWLDAAGFDLRYALRGLRTHPGFAIGIVVTLAIGIGANAAMFGVIDRLMLSPPPHVQDAARVGRVYFTASDPTNGTGTGARTSYGTYAALRDGLRSRAQVAADFEMPFPLGRGVDAMKARTMLVTASYFPLLGVHPRLGRFFAADEDRVPVGAHVAVLSYATWQRRFGGDAHVVGREILLRGLPYTVIGVAPRGFTGVDLEPVDVWVPLSAAADAFATRWYDENTAIWLQILVRPSPGILLRTLGEDATRIVRHVWTSWRPEQPMSHNVRVTLGGVDGLRADNGTRAPEASIALWLTGVALIVLLIACLNVANLLVARTIRRRREIAMRGALGVSRGRLASQLLIESLVLAVLSGVAALGVAWAASRVIRTTLLADLAWPHSPLDPRVLVVTVLIVIIATLLIGIAPVIQAGRVDVMGALKAGGRDSQYRRSKARIALLLAEASLSTVLLVGAGLFVRSLQQVRALDLGVDLHHVVSAEVRTPGTSGFVFGNTLVDRFYRRAVERVRALPGVEHAAIASGAPFRGMFAIGPHRPGGKVPFLSTGAPSGYLVSPGFFATLGMPIIRGRGFTDRDRRGAPRVAVVSETLARVLWPGEDPIGQCMLLDDDAAPCTTVVGVVKDARRHNLLHEDPTTQVYLPLDQGPAGYTANILFASGRGDPAALVPAIRRALLAVDPSIIYADVRPFAYIIEPQMRPWETGATLFTVLGVLALVLAAVGLYATVAYDVAQRTYEMGIRMALGARSGHVLRLVLREGVGVAIAGVVLGVGLALIAGHFITSLLFKTSSHDPAILGIVCITLFVVSVLATLLPAWRATRVDPSLALRAE